MKDIFKKKNKNSLLLLTLAKETPRHYASIEQCSCPHTKLSMNFNDIKKYLVIVSFFFLVPLEWLRTERHSESPLLSILAASLDILHSTPCNFEYVWCWSHHSKPLLTSDFPVCSLESWENLGPESCRLFLRRSSSTREGLIFRAVASDLQLTSDKLQTSVC